MELPIGVLAGAAELVGSVGRAGVLVFGSDVTLADVAGAGMATTA